MSASTRTLMAFILLPASISLGTATLAQEAADLEEVVVTGSYLYTGVDSPSPVTVISGEDIMAEAPQDMLTYFFTNVPQNFSSDTGAQTAQNNQPRVRGSSRNATINLRGLGDENTLNVLNGRRTVSNPTAPGGWPAVSINSVVPRIAIGRIETLLDGGSAIFGSDPVAGVVNFITDNDFRGVEVSAETRINEEVTDAGNHTVGLKWGGGNDRTSVLIAGEFSKTERISLDEIEGDNDPDPDVTPETGTGLTPVTGLSFDGRRFRGVVPTWVDPDCGNPAFGDPLFAKYPTYDAGDFIRETRIDMATGCSDPNGFNPGLGLQNDLEQNLLFVSLDHRFNDSVSANVEINYATQHYAETDYWGDSNASAWSPVPPSALGPTYAIPDANPGFVRARELDDTFGIGTVIVRGMARPGPVDVYQEGETMPFATTMPSSTDTDVARVAIGLDGAINDNWKWHMDVTSATYGVDFGLRDMVVANYELAINGFGGANCGVTDVRNPGGTAPGTGNCFYYNPFMSSALPDAASLGLANDPAMLEWLTPMKLDVYETEFRSADFLVTGEFGELAGGPIGVALGAAIRNETLSRDADERSNNAEFASTGFVNDYFGEQEVQSLFFELAMPLSDDVNLQIAARNENYDGTFSETTPKIAVNWTPTEDLTLRASYGTAFRGPSVIHTQASQYFSGMARQYVVVDGEQYGNNGALTFPYEIQPNPDTQPQTSDNLSAGFDYNVNNRISVGATWVDIAFEDRIVSPTAPTVVNGADCLNTDANGIPILAGGEITFVPLDQGGCAIATDPAFPITPSNFGSLVGGIMNLGGLDAEFLDLRASILFNAGAGSIRFTPNVTITTKYEFPNALNSAGVDNLCADGLCNGIGRDINATTGMGGNFNGVTAMPRWQGNFPVVWNVNDAHRLRLTANYRDSLNPDIRDLSEAEAAVFVHEEGQWTVSGNYTWRIGGGASLAFSVLNLFQTDPPESEGARFNRRQREYGLQFRYSLQN